MSRKAYWHVTAFVPNLKPQHIHHEPIGCKGGNRELAIVLEDMAMIEGVHSIDVARRDRNGDYLDE